MATKNENAAKENGGLLCLVSYILLWLTGIIVYVTEGQKDKRVKFHSLQAIFLGVITFIISLIPIPFLWILTALLWLYGIYVGVKAYGGVDVEIPVLGDYARRYSTSPAPAKKS